VGQQVRTIRATLDDLEDGWRRIQRLRQQHALPAPTPAALRMAVTVLEVRAGLRPPHQLERLSHYSLWRFWARLADPPDDTAIPIVPRPLAVTVRELTPGLVDATVVIDFAGHPHALGLRLDGAPGFWQLVELDYPTGPVVTGPPPNHALRTVPDGRRDTPLPHDPARAPDRSWFLKATGQLPRGDLPLAPGPGEGLGIELE
jgi:hypothetical protein